MAALDFKEIPPAHVGQERDQFELFAREVFAALGFRIVQDPDRGADGGRDILAEESRSGPGGTNVIRWLISCKHKAHTGSSVTPVDEPNVRDRLGTHRCDGFAAFYSTVPSSGLSSILNGLRPQFEYLQLDAEVIERRLLDTPRGRGVAARFMPKSFAAWNIVSQATSSTKPAPDPHRSFNSFFLHEPHRELTSAMEEAAARGVPVFAVIYNTDHPTHSKIDFALGYFMEYQTTKKLVDQHFVAMVGPSSAPELAALVPEDDPLELCLWVVLMPDGKIVRREGVYANADEGMKRVRQVVTQVES